MSTYSTASCTATEFEYPVFRYQFCIPNLHIVPRFRYEFKLISPSSFRSGCRKLNYFVRQTILLTNFRLFLLRGQDCLKFSKNQFFFFFCFQTVV